MSVMLCTCAEHKTCNTLYCKPVSLHATNMSVMLCACAEHKTCNTLYCKPVSLHTTTTSVMLCACAEHKTCNILYCKPVSLHATNMSVMLCARAEHRKTCNTLYPVMYARVKGSFVALDQEWIRFPLSQSVLRILDVFLGFRIQFFSIPDPGSRVKRFRIPDTDPHQRI
jgi:hypothetical protein